MNRVEQHAARMTDRTLSIIEAIENGEDFLHLVRRMDQAAPWDMLYVSQAAALDAMEAEREAMELLNEPEA